MLPTVHTLSTHFHQQTYVGIIVSEHDPLTICVADNSGITAGQYSA